MGVAGNVRMAILGVTDSRWGQGNSDTGCYDSIIGHEVILLIRPEILVQGIGDARATEYTISHTMHNNKILSHK